MKFSNESASAAGYNQGANSENNPAGLREKYITSVKLLATEHKLPVFPCKPNKHPWTQNGFKSATTDPDKIRQWFIDHPDALTGVPTGRVSRLLVIDIDPDGATWYMENSEHLRAGRIHKTQRGHHLIYRMPNSDIRCSASKIAPGVDVRANGGYVIWWPLDGLEAIGDLSDINDPPDWLLTLLTESIKNKGSKVNEAIPEGQRNCKLMSLAGSMRRTGMTVDEIEVSLLSINSDRCSPPLPEDEVQRIAVNVGKYEPAESTQPITLEYFRAYMPDHKYIFTPTRDLWPTPSVDARIEWPNGPDDKPMKPSRWLDAYAAVEQMTWAPGLPMLIEHKLIDTGGWIDHKGCTCFNLYRPPNLKHGDPAKAGLWIDHVERVYPGESSHIIRWLAQRVQHPSEKLNHALVLGGKPGIGKDTILEPVKYAVGPWNCHEVNPIAMLGRFNGFVKSVILRVSEARDLGNVDRFAFYDHTKSLIAAPPDVIRVDEKNIREYSVPNVCGVIITTNHKSDGLHLPADDRRHYVAWSELDKDQFTADYWNRIWQWYDAGGTGHVAAYLTTLDLAGFDPKAPPPKTEAFWHIVNAARPPEESELADILDSLDWPDAVTLDDVITRARSRGEHEFADWLADRRHRRTLPHRLESVGYEPVRNTGPKDGLFKIYGRRQVVYAKATLSISDRYAAATTLMQ